MAAESRCLFNSSTCCQCTLCGRMQLWLSTNSTLSREIQLSDLLASVVVGLATSQTNHIQKTTLLAAPLLPTYLTCLPQGTAYLPTVVL